MIAMEINLNITISYLHFETRVTTEHTTDATETFRNIFLDTVIGNAKLRPSFIICWGAQGRWSRCGPRHPILHSNIFFM